MDCANPIAAPPMTAAGPTTRCLCRTWPSRRRLCRSALLRAPAGGGFPGLVLEQRGRVTGICERHRTGRSCSRAPGGLVCRPAPQPRAQADPSRPCPGPVPLALRLRGEVLVLTSVEIENFQSLQQAEPEAGQVHRGHRGDRQRQVRGAARPPAAGLQRSRHQLHHPGGEGLPGAGGFAEHDKRDGWAVAVQRCQVRGKDAYRAGHVLPGDCAASGSSPSWAARCRRR